MQRHSSVNPHSTASPTVNDASAAIVPVQIGGPEGDKPVNSEIKSLTMLEIPEKLNLRHPVKSHFRVLVRNLDQSKMLRGGALECRHTIQRLFPLHCPQASFTTPTKSTVHPPAVASPVSAPS
jgi:hypothetical protein